MSSSSYEKEGKAQDVILKSLLLEFSVVQAGSALVDVVDNLP